MGLIDIWFLQVVFIFGGLFEFWANQPNLEKVKVFGIWVLFFLVFCRGFFFFFFFFLAFLDDGGGLVSVEER